MEKEVKEVKKVKRVNVKFSRRFHYKNQKTNEVFAIEPGKVVNMGENDLKAFNKRDYEIVRGIEKKGEEAKDIPAEDKDTSEVTFEIE